MTMMILAATGQTMTIKQIAQYLYKHIDGAYSITTRGNEYIVDIVVYYEIPIEVREKYRDAGLGDDLFEMNIKISITTYANKFRINLIAEDGRTIMHSTMPNNSFKDIQEFEKWIWKKITQTLNKEFEDYDFVY